RPWEHPANREGEFPLEGRQERPTTPAMGLFAQRQALLVLCVQPIGKSGRYRIQGTRSRALPEPRRPREQVKSVDWRNVAVPDPHGWAGSRYEAARLVLLTRHAPLCKLNMGDSTPLRDALQETEGACRY